MATILAFIRKVCFENLDVYKITLGHKFGLTFWPFSLKLAFKMTKVYLKHLIFFQNGTTLTFCKAPNFAGLKKLLNATMQIEDLLTFWQAEDISWVRDCSIWDWATNLKNSHKKSDFWDAAQVLSFKNVLPWEMSNFFSLIGSLLFSVTSCFTL